MERKLLSSKRMHKTFTFEAKAVNEKEYTIDGVFSTPAVDRHEESVIQSGWKLGPFMDNPVVLWSHDNMQFPLGIASKIGFDSDGNLAGTLKFAVEEYEMAATAFRLMKGKFLRAFSVGFINNVYEVDNGTEVVKLVENELLEISVVNIPANQEALAKIKHIDLLNEKTEDDEADEPEENGRKAVEILVGIKDEKIIRSAIKALTDALNGGAEPDNQGDPSKVEHARKEPGTKKIPVKTLNKAISSLLGAKKRSKNKNKSKV